ncbi:hypothetical protein WN867_08295 [Tetragenococcus halophilus]|uniref:hypothetical protein n=1 Tax=Tetragenococcus halophilus TaxID=51669 RepID=UPI0030C8DBD3
MAERRMFAKTIIDSDAFLDMPLSSQTLYFHLSMRADDEGFINNPKKIQRMIGCSEDDLKLLMAKKFILVFDNGVIVIKHWKIHNYIQKDRYKPTVYQDEKQQLGLKENKAYTMDTECIQDVSKMDSQVRLGKDRLDKDKANEKGSKNELEERFNDLWKEYPNKKGKDNAFKAYKKAVEDGVTDEVILDGIRRYNKEIQLKKTEKKYIAYGSTWFNQKRWEDDYLTNDYSNKEEKTNNANLASFDDIDWAEIYG